MSLTLELYNYKKLRDEFILDERNLIPKAEDFDAKVDINKKELTKSFFKDTDVEEVVPV